MSRTPFGVGLIALGFLAASAPSRGMAQPVSFQLKNDVPAGQKPRLTVIGVTRVTDLRLELVRDDGEHFQTRQAALEGGHSVQLPIGDGKPGKAHYTGKLAAMVPGEGGGPWSYELAFDTVVRAALTLTYDFEHLDLEKHELRFTQSRPAGKAELVVLDEEGREIGAGQASYHKEKEGTWLPISWTVTGPGRLMMIKLRVVAADGLAAGAELVPWTMPVEHEDVAFATDSSAIAADQMGKLDASVKKIEEAAKRAERYVRVRLYVAGHTDTVGTSEHNRTLSLARARAIAEYFRKKGVKLPISYEGFGEDLPRVQTPDNTEEARNRRADYVLGSVGASPPAGYGGANWKAIK